MNSTLNEIFSGYFHELEEPTSERLIRPTLF